MGEIKLATVGLNHLRKWPRVYHTLRAIRRSLRDGVVEAFRLEGRGVRWGAARGFYRGLADVEQGVRPGRRVLPGQTLPDLPDSSLIVQAGMGQNGRQPWPVFWLREELARLVGPSLALMGAGKRLMVESVYGEEFCRSDPSYRYVCLPRATFLPGRWTSVVHAWSEGFYHWFTDALPRLALLTEFPADTGILVRGPLKRYQRESLQLLGLLDRVRVTPEDHVVVEEYYFSSPVGMTGCTNPYAVQWLRQTFLPRMTGEVVGEKGKFETPPYFCIRRRGKTRGIRNQDALWAMLARQGWAVVDLEELSLVEQIAWFAQAKGIVGEHGAAFTHFLWVSPECQVLELCAEGFLNGCYEGIMRCVGGRHAFRIYPSAVDCSIEVPEQDLWEWVHGLDKQTPRVPK